MAFEKIKEKSFSIRVLLFIGSIIVWFSIIYLLFPDDENAVGEARSVHSYWLLSVFAIFALWQVFFKRKANS